MTKMIDTQYEDFLCALLEDGLAKSDRTGVGTKSRFGHQMRFDAANGFPLITSKFVPLKAVIVELLWFLRGETNIAWLKENNCHIWDEWAAEDGSLGPVYGAQWRSWPKADGTHVDQIKQVIETLKSNPDSRRIIVSAWNVGQLDEMALHPCHAFFQFYASPEGENGRRKLSLQLYQRSADWCLGVPFNIASYFLLMMMVAQQVDMDLGEFIWTGGDCHIYQTHLEGAQRQTARTIKTFPDVLITRKPDSIDDYHFSDFVLLNYEPGEAIKYQVAV